MISGPPVAPIMAPCQAFALVRHPPVRGGAGLCYGRRDMPLAEPERAIPRLLTALEDLRGARIITSPLARCRLVAQALADHWGQKPDYDSRLLELDFGDWEGLNWDAVPRAALDDWAADPWGFAAPGGESGAALAARVSALWRSCRAAGGPFLLITHGGPLKVLHALAQGQAPDLAAAAPPLGSVFRGVLPWSPDPPPAAAAL